MSGPVKGEGGGVGVYRTPGGMVKMVVWGDDGKTNVTLGPNACVEVASQLLKKSVTP